ncbi:MAG: allantoicase [Myxococcaceae bacterium]|nr:allantoicase [Myxococcaceae bacterium]
MSQRPNPPEPFKDLVDLASDALGAFALFATDDYFAEKENLLKPTAAEWIEGKYTDKGKWMDGWESQRRRVPGHDWAVIRLGVPGFVHGIVADTTHFKGNAPQEVALEGIDAPDTATAAELEASTGWAELLPRTAVKPDFQNVLPLKAPSPRRVTHVRLHIYPDGGVARLRVYGVVDPAPRTFWRQGSADLAAVENGGTVVEVSDQFFGPPSNLLLPGRGVNMGDGWETKRRRTPGSDWAVIRLGRRGVLERIELDTHFFKGNAPQAVLIECLDEDEVGAAELKARLRAPKGWDVLVAKSPLVQHRRHQLEPARPKPVTHLRVHIYPHGGVNRLRLYGHALDTPAERERLDELNAMDDREVAKLFTSLSGSKRWAQRLWEKRPFLSVRELFRLVDDVWWGLEPKDWLEAFAAHPRIGAKKAPKRESKEQSGMAAADAETKKRLAAVNEAYFEKFGFIFIVFASGKSAAQMLELAEERVKNAKKVELENAAAEQAKITKLRLEKWLLNRS